MPVSRTINAVEIPNSARLIGACIIFEEANAYGLLGLAVHALHPTHPFEFLGARIDWIAAQAFPGGPTADVWPRASTMANRRLLELLGVV